MNRLSLLFVSAAILLVFQANIAFSTTTTTNGNNNNMIMMMGPSGEAKTSMQKMFGMIPEFMMNMPTELANQYTSVIMDIETWKTTMPKKDMLMVLYTDAMTAGDNMRMIKYQKMLKFFGVSAEEMAVANEIVSLNAIASSFMNTIETSYKEIKGTTNNMFQYMRKMMNLDNTYNPNDQNRATTPGYGLSPIIEDKMIKEFGTIPTFVSQMPTTFADYFYNKWQFITKESTMTMKMRTLLMTVSIMSTPVKSKNAKPCLKLFKKMTMLMGTTEQEMTEVATMIAMSRMQTAWMKSTHYTKEQMIKDLDMAMMNMERKTKNNEF